MGRGSGVEAGVRLGDIQKGILGQSIYKTKNNGRTFQLDILARDNIRQNYTLKMCLVLNEYSSKVLVILYKFSVVLFCLFVLVWGFFLVSVDASQVKR